MSTASNIEWTDTTWNPVSGCRKVSPGCKNCYAETMAKRLRAMGQAGYLRVIDDRGRWTGDFETDPARLAEPLGWKKPRRVFVNSMSDLFGEGVPFDFIAAVFGVMAATPRHTYQVLTKRPARMVEFFRWIERHEAEASEPPWARSAVEIDGTVGAHVIPALVASRFARRTLGFMPDAPTATWERWPLPNVWIGVSTEDQATADERIPLLLQVPAAVRFISAEPLLGPVNLGLLGTLPKTIAPIYTATYERLDWIIVGGESGPGARPCDVSWIRSIVRQCDEAGVPVFVKQLGARARGVPSCMGCEGERFDGDRCERCGDVIEIVDGQRVLHLRDPKGGDPAEWPEDLRVRQWPREVAGG